MALCVPKCSCQFMEPVSGDWGKIQKINYSIQKPPPMTRTWLLNSQMSSPVFLVPQFRGILFTEVGIYASRRMIHIPLPPGHRRDLLTWCRQHHTWTQEQWDCALLTE
ncbi:hypothetical protein TNCV_850361 [Trichonephila clavipes]|uniref:Uncharacterized protein n=1 Tax=Trichonephila clavipes TaxID=2585209 RepID=A0A8X6S6L4_TRICX|nr:hypothetical protein TNCV_850361 [Trichonephila clavipes]